MLTFLQKGKISLAVMAGLHTWWQRCLLLAVLLPLVMSVSATEVDLRQGELLRQRIAELQGGGPYQPALAEVTSELAAYHQANGEHEVAAVLYADALQVSRVNNGLYNPQQLMLLQQLIESHRALAQWQQVDDFQTLLFFTQGRVYAPDSRDYRLALAQHAEWKLEAWQRNLSPTGVRGPQQIPVALLDIQTLYDTALDAETVDEGERFELLYGRARTELAIARHMTDLPLRAFESSTPRYTNRRVCRTVTDQSGASQRICWTEQVENPAYRSAQRDERRMQMDRANLRFRRTVEALEAMPGSGEPARQQQVTMLQSQIAELQQASRRALLRGW